jgi:hypothetical protein
MFTLNQRIGIGAVLIALLAVFAAPAHAGSATPQTQQDKAAPAGEWDGFRFLKRGEPNVYLGLCGKRSWITSESVYNRLFVDWSGIVELSSLAGTAPGPALASSARLVNLTDSPRVYLINGGKSHWIENEFAFNRYNFDASKIEPIDADEFMSYTPGPCIIR